MHKINKKTIFTTSALAFTFFNRASAFPGLIGLANNNSVFQADNARILNPDLFPFRPEIWLFHFLIFSILTYLIVRLYLCWKKREILNKKMAQCIKAVHELQKPLELIKGPLVDILKDNNLEESAKNKLLLSIWSTSSMQKTVNDLIGQEASNDYFQPALKSISGKRAPIKERIESKIASHKQQKEEIRIEKTDELPGLREVHTDQLFIEKLMAIIKTHLEDSNFTVDVLSQRIGMSRSSLYHKIKDICGMAPADFIRQYRLEKAKELLKTRQFTISEVSYKTGFSDVKYFRAVFKKQFKRNPGYFLKTKE